MPERENASGELLGYPRVQALFEERAGGAPEEIVEGLLAACSEWSGGAERSDDITLVLLSLRVA